MKTVLIADKSPANREFLRDLLQNNYNVITLEDVRGLDQIERIPDIVLAGRETAREVMKTIERIAPYKKIPLLLLLDTFTLPDEQILKEYNAVKSLIIPSAGKRILEEIKDALEPTFEEELQTTLEPTFEEELQTIEEQEFLPLSAVDIISEPPDENVVLEQEIVIGETPSEVLEEGDSDREEIRNYWGSVVEDSFKKDIVPKYLEATEIIMKEMALHLRKTLEAQIREVIPSITQKVVIREVENLKRLFNI